MAMLHEFAQKRLKSYDTLRNNPTEQALSNMSPYLHFGHVRRDAVLASRVSTRSPIAPALFVARFAAC
jgi:deoxyribodipyrimidine photo-lyase